MKNLSALDLIFFLVESENSPKHVAGLIRCKKPAGAPANYGRKLVADLKDRGRLVEPFNLVVNFIGLKGPHWERCTGFDVNEHVFYHRPKRVISWQDTLQRAALLHEPMMDRSRPLWEFHLIDNIRGGRFAIYIKLHHAYADGMTMRDWFQNSFSANPDSQEITPVWELRAKPRNTSRHTRRSLLGTARKIGSDAVSQLQTAGGLFKLTAQQYIERTGLTRDAVALLFNTEKNTPMTGSASPGRYLATTAIPMDDIRKVCRDSRSTLNHVALTCVDGALHRYLDEQGAALDHHLTIQMPVNLRRGDSSKAGNKLGIALVDLAEPDRDRRDRHREIGYRLRNVKSQIFGVPDTSFEQLTILVGGIGEAIEKLKLTDRLPTNGHTLVSNLPGPVEPLYFCGSAIERMYPISTLAPGLRMNITLFSYAGILNIGIVATHDVRDLQKLADYLREELYQLQLEFG